MTLGECKQNRLAFCGACVCKHLLTLLVGHSSVAVKMEGCIWPRLDGGLYMFYFHIYISSKDLTVA